MEHFTQYTDHKNALNLAENFWNAFDNRGA